MSKNITQWAFISFQSIGVINLKNCLFSKKKKKKMIYYNLNSYLEFIIIVISIEMHPRIKWKYFFDTL
jgi:hypothetical protein